MRTRTTPATLWIGERLSFIEVLSLKSMVDQGMKPTLYCYDDVGLVPEGVAIADAAAIMPRDRIFVNKERNSLAPFADLFRYRMLAETDYYWVDADVLALRNFTIEDDWLAGWFPPVVAIGVLSFPKSSPTLQALASISEGEALKLPWLAGRRRRAPVYKSLADLPYKALGPLAVTELMKQNDEIGHVLPSRVHYPLYPRHILAPARRLMRKADFSESESIHLYASVQQTKLRESGLNVPPEGSVLAHFLKQAEIDPNDCPLVG